MARTFYRIVTGPVARRDDFLSHQALGRPLRRATPEAIRAYDGVSVFETLAQAREAATRFRALGDYAAEIVLPEDLGIRVERTFLNQPGHHTLLGKPDDMIKFVTRVFALTDRE